MPLWWCPDPRFVLWPAELHVPTSLRSAIRKFEPGFTINKAFDSVVVQCSKVERQGQHGTWLNHEMQLAYQQLHSMGIAMSFETWLHGELAGGLYGIKLGNMFYGESMFTQVSNAGKVAFVLAVRWLVEVGVELIDCQVHTDHLERFGARFIPRKLFLERVHHLTSNESTL